MEPTSQGAESTEQPSDKTAKRNLLPGLEETPDGEGLREIKQEKVIPLVSGDGEDICLHVYYILGSIFLSFYIKLSQTVCYHPGKTTGTQPYKAVVTNQWISTHQ